MFDGRRSLLVLEQRFPDGFFDKQVSSTFDLVRWLQLVPKLYSLDDQCSEGPLDLLIKQ